MHVLITADTVGGVWTYARELVAQLARHKVRVTLVSFGEIPAPHQTEWLEGLTGVEYHPTAFKLEWMQDSAEDLKASADYLQSIVEEVKPDLLHLNQFYYGTLPCDLPRLVVAHSDVVSWWFEVHGHEPKPDHWNRWYRDVVSRGLAGATSVVAPSRWMLEAVERFYGRPANAAVIYNGRDPRLFNPHLAKEQQILAVGRIWDGGKQVHLLTQSEPPATTVVVGSERNPDSNVQAARVVQGAAGSRIHLKGPQSDAQLRQLFSRSAVFAATSRYEPFGLAPLEAALSRCALVMNDIPTYRELWGDSALYFRRNDGRSLHETLARVIAEPQAGLRYGDLAYQRARIQYNSDRMASDYMSLYRNLVATEVVAA
jgi:glycosyltransferase involved in cell wall biosynthesis